jgi:hypothetical protein
MTFVGGDSDNKKLFYFSIKQFFCKFWGGDDLRQTQGL